MNITGLGRRVRLVIFVVVEGEFVVLSGPIVLRVRLGGGGGDGLGAHEVARVSLGLVLVRVTRVVKVCGSATEGIGSATGEGRSRIRCRIEKKCGRSDKQGEKKKG